MSETVNSNQPQVVHPPYQYALNLLAVHYNAEMDKAVIDEVWDFESVGEAQHFTLEEAKTAEVPLPSEQGVFPIIFVYDKEFEEGFADPIFVSANIKEVHAFIENFENTYEPTES